MAAIGFIGLGKMGMPILSRMQSKYEISGIYNRTRSKTTIFKTLRSFDEPFQMGSTCDIIFMSLTGDEACEQVMFGQTGLTKTLTAGKIIVNLSTVSYQFALSTARRLQAQAVVYLDAPVLGSTDAALSGTLVSLVSGEAKASESIREILGTYSKETIYLGVNGNAIKMKLISNMAMAANLAVAAEAIVASENLGITKEKAISVLLSGGASSRILELKKNSILEEEFVPGFALQDMLKDLGYGTTLSSGASVALPLEALAMQYYVAAASIGLGKLDYSSVIRAFRFLSGKS